VGTSLVGNNGLQPEQMISYDAGYQGWYFKHRLRARLDLFYNQVSELIAFNAPSPTNLGKADIYGGEAGFEFLATKWLTGFANVSYVDIGQSVTGTVKRGAPTWKANGGLRAEFNNGLNGEAAFHYVGAATYPISGLFLAAQNFPGGQRAPDQTVGSYILVNVRVGYQFWHDKAEIALSGFNALNDKHQEHPLGDVIGSRVMGWLTIKY
jgi:iron complex outermembrane receptor protein